MALWSCHQILSPWPHGAGKTLVYLYHVIKFSPVYLDPLESPSRIVWQMWGEDMIALWRSEGTKWPWSHPFFALAPAQTNSVTFSVNAINKRFGIWCWFVLSIAFFLPQCRIEPEGMDVLPLTHIFNLSPPTFTDPHFRQMRLGRIRPKRACLSARMTLPRATVLLIMLMILNS